MQFTFTFTIREAQFLLIGALFGLAFAGWASPEAGRAVFALCGFIFMMSIVARIITMRNAE